MPIDPSTVKWDDKPAIDPATIKWDDAPKQSTYGERLKHNTKAIAGEAKDALLGLVGGAGTLGNVALTINSLGQQGSYADRAKGMDAGLRELGADTNSASFKAGKLGGEVAGTAGVGGALAGGARAMGAAPEVINALRTGGMSTGSTRLGTTANLATRSLGGAVTGGATVGLASPDDAGKGALIGGALPPVLKGLGAAGAAVGRGVVGTVAPDVQALAKRAKELGIDIPADRIANSKPLNAVAAGLNYVPGSGRAGVEKRMVEQLDTALSKTFGHDSPNVTMALRKAQGELGAKFDTTLKGTAVKVDEPLLNELGALEQTAKRELGQDGLHAIKGQIDELLEKGASGQIDGQAAYNIKRTLDRIGQRNTPEAFHAREMKKALMSALDRSLGPDAAKAFKTTRQQYGNMLELENLAQNGAEGGISVGRLANLKGINNPELQELADIAAQFVKTRESNHGAAQRAFAGMGAAGIGSMVGGPVGALAGLGGSMAAGRAANGLLNSQALKNSLLRAPGTEATNALAAPVYRSAPRAGSLDTSRR